MGFVRENLLLIQIKNKLRISNVENKRNKILLFNDDFHIH